MSKTLTSVCVHAWERSASGSWSCVRCPGVWESSAAPPKEWQWEYRREVEASIPQHPQQCSICTKDFGDSSYLLIRQAIYVQKIVGGREFCVAVHATEVCLAKLRKMHGLPEFVYSTQMCLGVPI